ncbi:MAG: PilZ domain-containing protein [Thermoanaerobaculia bacterium]|nr:PilZ domain-containing protein [Thermoanaerobaculia bacterium]
MSNEPNASDRRNEPRVGKVQLVQITRFDEEGFHADIATGRTLNVSRGGIRLELHHALPLRSVVNLSVLLGEDILEVTGKVVYLEAIDDERCAMGVAFGDLSPTQVQQIERYLGA